MQIALRLTVLLAFVSTVASAQSERAAQGGPERLAVNTVAHLFEDIQLTSEQHRRAVAIVQEAQTEQRKLLPLMTRAAWDRIVALQIARDSSLKALLTSDAQRTKFEKRAAEMMPKPPPLP